MVELIQWFVVSDDEFPFGDRHMVYHSVLWHPRFYYAPNNTLADLQTFTINTLSDFPGG